ncbi:MAG TPA: DUF4129 domain-containing protein [Thermoplasmata archaeon]|nr:DUF4129 domain-containing protein [Thermoplasmata archaeon]
MRVNWASPGRSTCAVLLALAVPGDGPVYPERRVPGWSEVPDDEELLPGDLGEGTADFEAESWYATRRARRIPLSFSAIVLLLTLTVGIGMAAGLLAGPSSWDPTGHSATPGNTTIRSPNGISNQTNNSGLPNGTNPSSGMGNSTGNGTTGHNSSGSGNGTGNQTGGHTGNSSRGNSTGRTGNSTGGKNGTGSSGTGNGSKSGGGGGNRSSSRTGPPGGTNQSRTIYRNTLPWLPTDTRLWILIGAAVSMGGLALALLMESVRPPPDRTNPWITTARPRRPRRSRAPTISPRDALEGAIDRLRSELLRYERAGSAVLDLEVRERIIHLYGTLLEAVSPGLGNLAGRTPREVEWLAVTYLGVRPETAHELTWLFEEARYSSHHLTPAAVVRAQRALAFLVDDLERRSLAL